MIAAISVGWLCFGLVADALGLAAGYYGRRWLSQRQRGPR